MKKITIFLLCVMFLIGCAPYRIQKGVQKPYDEGFVATREGKVILEYTVGKDGNVPDDMRLAQERFKRRRRIVEDYYKKMGIIENRLKEHGWNRLIYFWSLVGGVFNAPVRFVSEYRYNHDPEYRQKVDKIVEGQEARLEARVEQLRRELAAYIEEDLRREEEAKVLLQLSKKPPAKTP